MVGVLFVGQDMTQKRRMMDAEVMLRKARFYQRAFSVIVHHLISLFCLFITERFRQATTLNLQPPTIPTGRGRQLGQVAVSGQHVPRDAHAAQRHHRRQPGAGHCVDKIASNQQTDEGTPSPYILEVS